MTDVRCINDLVSKWRIPQEDELDLLKEYLNEIIEDFPISKGYFTKEDRIRLFMDEGYLIFNPMEPIAMHEFSFAYWKLLKQYPVTPDEAHTDIEVSDFPYPNDWRIVLARK